MSKNEDSPNDDDVINQNLKRVYDDVAGQDIPDRFKDLLAQLKAQDSPAPHSSSEGDE